MAGIELASAYVSLIPSFKGGAGKISEELGGPAKKAGDDAGEKASEGFGSKFKAGIKVAALAAAALIGASLVQGMDVEAATDKLGAQLGLTADESKRIGGVAGHLFANAYGESIEDVTAATGAVVSSIDGMRNASSSAVEGITAKVLDLASAFEIDTARAAQIAGQAVSSGLAKDATQALDLITASLQAVPTAVREDLLDALDEYGPFLDAVGLTGQKAFETLVGGAEKGMYGIDKTGDAIKEFGIRATDMSNLTGTAFDTLGLDMQGTTNDLLAGGDRASKAFSTIVKGLQKIKDPAAQSAAALALFGTPLEDLGVTEIPKFLDSLTSAEGSLDGFEGAAGRMGATLNDNAKTNLTAFWRSAQMAFVDIIGGKVIPVISWVAKILLSALKPALDLVGAGFKAVGKFAKDHPMLFKLIGGAVAGAVAGFVAYKAIMGTITAVTKAWAAAQALLNFAMAANPLGIILVLLGALIGIIVVLWNNSAGFRDFVIGAWAAIQNAFTVAINAIVTAAKVAWDLITVSFQSFVQFFVDRWNWAKDTFWAVIDFIVSVATGAWCKITSSFGAAVQWVKDRWNGLLDIFRSVGGFFANIGKGIGEGIKNGVKSAVNFVIGLINGLIKGINFLIRGINLVNPFSDIPNVPSVPKLAKGGLVTDGGMAMVGERGRELVSLPAGARVTSNRDTESIMAGSGGGGVHIDHLEVSFPGALNAMSKADLRKAAEVIKDEIRELERSRA